MQDSNQIYHEQCPAENLCIKCSGDIILSTFPLFPIGIPHLVCILVLLLIESKQRTADTDTEPEHNWTATNAQLACWLQCPT